MSALREVLLTHDVSEAVRAHLNARFLVHTKRTCKTAAANVSKAKIIAALIYDEEWGFTWLLRHAAKNNNTQLLQFLYEYAEDCPEKDASEYGIMKWPTWDEFGLMGSATEIANTSWHHQYPPATGMASIDVMKWLMQQNPPYDPCMDELASVNIDLAISGSLEAIKILDDAGIYEDPAWTANILYGAAQGGQWHIMKWMERKLIPWSESWDYDYLCDAAARGNQVQMMKYLCSLEPPPPCEENTMKEALDNESFDVARWLRAQTPPCPLDHPSESDEAVQLDKLGLVEIWDWLAQVRDEQSIQTLQQKQQGQI